MSRHNFLAVNLPYCLRRLDDGRYVVLNRSFRPIGFKTMAEIDYEDHPVAAWYKGLTANVAAKLSWNSSLNLDAIFLYNDGCIPTESKEEMGQYLARLRILGKLKVSEIRPHQYQFQGITTATTATIATQ